MPPQGWLLIANYTSLHRVDGFGAGGLTTPRFAFTVWLNGSVNP
jgi:hypothetical protein